MSRFLLFYFFAYGGAHCYFYRKLRNACTLNRKRQRLIVAALALLFSAPLLARTLETSRFDLIPELLSGIGYLWMGLLFLFVTAAAALDLLNLLLRKGGWRSPGVGQKTHFLIASVYTVIAGTYGYHEAGDIVTEHLTIRTGRIPAAAGRIRIVQISDVHVGQIVRERRVRNILAAVNAAAPDILVSTGDLVDGHQKHFTGLEQLFAGVQPRLGKYAVPGNHEYYVGIDQSLTFMQAAGFHVLRQKNFELGGMLCITGVDDSRTARERTANALQEKRLLASAPKDGFRLLLKHRPVVEKSSEGLFDLQLSGHVHKGQIFPFNALTWISFPVRAGLTRLQSGSLLYVSRGTGVWGPPIRFLAPPEITVIDLMPATTADRKI